MAHPETQIANLLYRYAEYIDGGDFEGAANLFSHARIKTPLGEISAEEVLALWRGSIILHEDGTPRTKHLVTNPIIEIDESGTQATCRSYYTVMQQVGTGPLEAVMCGRYHDRFECVENKWRFSYRDYSLHDMPGNMTQHSYHWQKSARTS